MKEERLRRPALATNVAPADRARTLVALLRVAWREYQHDYARYFASAMVFYALVSLVPLLLLLLAVLGLLLRVSDVVTTARRNALVAIEAGFGADLRVAIEQLVQGMEQQSLVVSIVSLIALAWTASKVLRHLRMTFRALWKYAPPLVSGSLPVVIRKTVTEKAIAFGMVVAGTLLLLVAIGFFALINWLSSASGIGFLVVLPTMVIVPAVFAFLFMHLPPVRLSWRHVWIAALLCATAWVIGVELLAVYGAFVGSHASAYGAIGGVLVVMLWMNMMSQVVFYGAEVCKVAHAWATEGSPAQGADDAAAGSAPRSEWSA